jgi:hypothetical protein
MQMSYDSDLELMLHLGRLTATRPTPVMLVQSLHLGTKLPIRADLHR